MAFYKTKEVWKLKDQNVTCEKSFNTKRDLLKKLCIGSILLPNASFIFGVLLLPF